MNLWRILNPFHTGDLAARLTGATSSGRIILPTPTNPVNAKEKRYIRLETVAQRGHQAFSDPGLAIPVFLPITHIVERYFLLIHRFLETPHPPSLFVENPVEIHRAVVDRLWDQKNISNSSTKFCKGRLSERFTTISAALKSLISKGFGLYERKPDGVNAEWYQRLHLPNSSFELTRRSTDPNQAFMVVRRQGSISLESD